jgi:menaquinone-specific isochorismate synthase
MGNSQEHKYRQKRRSKDMVLDSQFLKSGSFLVINGQFFGSALPSQKNLVDLDHMLFGLQIQEYFSKKGIGFEIKGWKVSKIEEALEDLRLLEHALPKASKVRGSNQWMAPQFDSFRIQFEAVAQKIKNGQLIKSVPVTHAFLGNPLTDKEKIQLILNAIQSSGANPRLMAYGFWVEEEGVIGVTPEILLKKEGRIVSTVALAGTRPIQDQSHRLPLFQDSKERREHQLVIESLVTKLKEEGSLVISDTEVIELPTLEHLKTNISFQVEPGWSFLRCVERLHPTAALGPFPNSSREMEDFEKLEGQSKRKWFGAPLTFKLSEDFMVSLVMIRNLQWNRDGQKIYAGVGQIQESELEREWREACEKIELVKRLLLKGFP